MLVSHNGRTTIVWQKTQLTFPTFFGCVFVRETNFVTGWTNLDHFCWREDEVL